MPRQRRSRRRRISLVEYQVDHLQYNVQPIRQLIARWHLIRNARVADLGFRANDALSHCRGRRQESVRDLFGRQTAYLAQGQRELRLGCQGRVAAREDQPQLVVCDVLFIQLVDAVGGPAELLSQFFRQTGVEPRVPTYAVDGLEAANRHEPRARIGRYAIARPLLHRRGERVVQCLFGEVKAAKHAYQGCEDAARFRAIDAVHQLMRALGGHRISIDSFKKMLNCRILRRAFDYR